MGNNKESDRGGESGQWISTKGHETSGEPQNMYYMLLDLVKRVDILTMAVKNLATNQQEEIENE